jgi:hypothetical protein
VVPGRNLALSLRQIAAKFEEKTAQWLHSLGTGRSLQTNFHADYNKLESWSR